MAQLFWGKTGLNLYASLAFGPRGTSVPIWENSGFPSEATSQTPVPPGRPLRPSLGSSRAGAVR